MQCDPNLARADWRGRSDPAPQPGTGSIFIQPSVSHHGYIELGNTSYMAWVKLGADEAATSGADNRPMLTIKGHGVYGTFPRAYLMNGSKLLKARISEVGEMDEMPLEVTGCNPVAFRCALDLMVCGRGLVPDQDFPAFLLAYKNLEMSLVIPEQVMGLFLRHFNQGYVARVVATDMNGLNPRVELSRPITYPVGHHEGFNGRFPAPVAPTMPMNPPQQAGNYMLNSHFSAQEQAGYYGHAGTYNGAPFMAPIAGPPTAAYSMDLASVSSQLPQLQDHYGGGDRFYPGQAAGFPTNAAPPHYQGWGNGYNPLPPPPGFNHQQLETAAGPSDVDPGLLQQQMHSEPAAGAQAAPFGNVPTTNFSQTMNENGFEDISDASRPGSANISVDSSSSFGDFQPATSDAEQAAGEGDVFLQAMDPVLLTPSRFGISGSEIIHQKVTNNMEREQPARDAVACSVDGDLGQHGTAQPETNVQDDGGMPPEVVQAEHQSGLAPEASSAVTQRESGLAPVASPAVTETEEAQPDVVVSEATSTRASASPAPSTSSAVGACSFAVPSTSSAVGARSSASPVPSMSSAFGARLSASPSTSSAVGARSSALPVPSISSAFGARSSASPVPSTSTAVGVHVGNGRPSNDQPDYTAGQGSGSARARRSRAPAEDDNLPLRIPRSILKNRDIKKIEEWIWSGYTKDNTACHGVRLVYFCDHCSEVFRILYEARMHAYDVAMRAITFRCCWCNAHFGNNKEACVSHMMEDHALKKVPDNMRPQLPPRANGDDDLEPGEIRLPVRPTPPAHSSDAA